MRSRLNCAPLTPNCAPRTANCAPLARHLRAAERPFSAMLKDCAAGRRVAASKLRVCAPLFLLLNIDINKYIYKKKWGLAARIRANLAKPQEDGLRIARIPLFGGAHPTRKLRADAQIDTLQSEIVSTTKGIYHATMA